MKVALVAAFVVLAPVWSKKAISQSMPPKRIAELKGVSLKWIRAAEPVWRKQHLDVDGYLITVSDEGRESVGVILMSLDADPESYGSSGKRPGFEVEVRKVDGKILASHYVR